MKTRDLVPRQDAFELPTAARRHRGRSKWYPPARVVALDDDQVEHEVVRTGCSAPSAITRHADRIGGIASLIIPSRRRHSDGSILDWAPPCNSRRHRPPSNLPV